MADVAQVIENESPILQVLKYIGGDYNGESINVLKASIFITLMLNACNSDCVKEYVSQVQKCQQMYNIERLEPLDNNLLANCTIAAENEYQSCSNF